MVKYKIKPFNLDDEDLLWENFMCFARQLIPWESPQLEQLSDKQKVPLIAFIYSSEVMGDGHISFLDLYSKDILWTDIINAFKILSVPGKYIKILEKMPGNSMPVSEIADICQDEEEFTNEMDKIDKITIYVRQNHLDFFEYIS